MSICSLAGWFQSALRPRGWSYREQLRPVMVGAESMDAIFGDEDDAAEDEALEEV